MKNWRTVFVATDINDRATGEPLYVYTKVRPRWYWLLRRLRLFLGIVWRWHDTQRLDIKTSWVVSRVAMGLTTEAKR